MTNPVPSAFKITVVYNFVELVILPPYGFANLTSSSWSLFVSVSFGDLSAYRLNNNVSVCHHF